MLKLFRLLFAALAMVMSMAPACAVEEYWRAEFNPAVTADAPAADDPHWQPVELPYALRTDNPQSTGGWFRFRVTIATVPTEPQAVYLWWLNLNAAFYFNGEPIGNGGRMVAPISSNWNHPFLFDLPRVLWCVGDNELLIHLAAEPGWGLLSPLEIGPVADLKGDFELRHFLQYDLARSLALTLFLASFLVIVVWLRRRHEAQYFWFGLACLCWSVFTLYVTVRDPLIPNALFRWIGHFAINAWGVCFILFIRRYTGRKPRRREWLLAAYLAASALISAPVGLLWEGYAYFISHVFGFALLLITGLRVLGVWRKFPMLSIALCILLLGAVHDLAVGIPVTSLPEELLRIRLKYHFFILQYAAPGALLFITIHLGRRFIGALGQVETMNLELESRVEAGHRALLKSYEERARLERDQATTEERERIYRDLHDDIGAHLLSLTIRAKDPADADIARSALRNLRDVVSQSSRGDQLLEDLLADWHAEIDSRAADAKLDFAWRQAEDLPSVVVNAAAALNLGRVLREAVSNVVRHARAVRLVIEISRLDSDIRFVIADDGIGLGTGIGRGQRNMRARAQNMGGRIEWEAADPGCRVVLIVPEVRIRKET